MFEISENKKLVEKAYLVGIRWGRGSLAEATDHLEELAQLADTMGVPVAGRQIVSLAHPRPALLIGSGKCEEIVAECKRLGVDCLIFDDDLSPAQQRNWEKLSDICVIDRREVILDIFAQRAHTQEARLQVRLARLEYSLPRLRRAWTHLERQRGGAGLRGGAGELQLEVDQRLVTNQIAVIKRQLARVRKRRAVQRQERRANAIPNAAIVGYTNAGKSSLLNALTGADVPCEDKLFATLDPTTRRVALPDRREALVTDTVGFIRKLPHDLVESFKATLEETRLADVLIHVVDASHPNADQQIAATNVVLKEIGADGKPTILALNKMDLLADRAETLSLLALGPQGDAAERTVSLSAKTGEGIETLLAALASLCARDVEMLIIEAPASRYDLVALARREGDVKFEGYLDGSVWLEADMPPRLKARLAPYLRPALPEALQTVVR